MFSSEFLCPKFSSVSYSIGKIHPQSENCYYFLTFMSFQTCITSFRKTYSIVGQLDQILFGPQCSSEYLLLCFVEESQ